MKNECIVFFIDSLKELNETFLPYIQLFTKNNDILVVPSKTVISFKQFICEGVFKEYIQFLITSHKKIHLFLPIGLLPFQRIPLISFINNFFLFTLFSIRLNGKKPIVYVCGSEEMFSPHWLYIPGILKEKMCIYDLTQTPIKFKAPKHMQTLYEQKLQSYADILFVNKQMDSHRNYDYVGKTIILPDSLKKRRAIVNRTVNEFFS